MDFNGKIWTNLLFVPLYICIVVYEFYLEYIIRNQYMYVKTKRTYVKKITRKKLTKKKLWTLEWPKMNHIFINPHHNHFWMNFSFYFLNMYIKK